MFMKNLRFRHIQSTVIHVTWSSAASTIRHSVQNFLFVGAMGLSFSSLFATLSSLVRWSKDQDVRILMLGLDSAGKVKKAPCSCLLSHDILLKRLYLARQRYFTDCRYVILF